MIDTFFKIYSKYESKKNAFDGDPIRFVYEAGKALMSGTNRSHLNSSPGNKVCDAGQHDIKP